jgi:hypothetical protein
MKIRTSLRAGGSGCSPETQNYMKKALNMQSKVENCIQQGTVTAPPPYYGYVPPATTYPGYTGSYTYPDMSGACG